MKPSSVRFGKQTNQSSIQNDELLLLSTSSSQFDIQKNLLPTTSVLTKRLHPLGEPNLSSSRLPQPNKKPRSFELKPTVEFLSEKSDINDLSHIENQHDKYNASLLLNTSGNSSLRSSKTLSKPAPVISSALAGSFQFKLDRSISFDSKDIKLPSASTLQFSFRSRNNPPVSLCSTKQILNQMFDRPQNKTESQNIAPQVAQQPHNPTTETTDSEQRFVTQQNAVKDSINQYSSNMLLTGSISKIIYPKQNLDQPDSNKQTYKSGWTIFYMGDKLIKGNIPVIDWFFVYSLWVKKQPLKPFETNKPSHSRKRDSKERYEYIILDVQKISIQPISKILLRKLIAYSFTDVKDTDMVLYRSEINRLYDLSIESIKQLSFFDPLYKSTMYFDAHLLICMLNSYEKQKQRYALLSVSQDYEHRKRLQRYRQFEKLWKLCFKDTSRTTAQIGEMHLSEYEKLLTNLNVNLNSQSHTFFRDVYHDYHDIKQNLLKRHSMTCFTMDDLHHMSRSNQSNQNSSHTRFADGLFDQNILNWFLEKKIIRTLVSNHSVPEHHSLLHTEQNQTLFVFKNQYLTGSNIVQKLNTYLQIHIRNFESIRLNDIFEKRQAILSKLLDNPSCEIQLQRLDAHNQFLDDLVKRNPDIVPEYSKIHHRQDALEFCFSSNLDVQQQKAYYSFFFYNMLIITGGPGCGKTFLLKHIIKESQLCFEPDQILALAPTGCAALSLLNSTGYGCTIDYALRKFSGNPNDVRVLIVDEMSMVNAKQFECILNCFFSARLIKFVLVGDPNQLSRGPGCFFTSLIRACKRTCHPLFDESIHELKQNHRVQQINHSLLDKVNDSILNDNVDFWLSSVYKRDPHCHSPPSPSDEMLSLWKFDSPSVQTPSFTNLMEFSPPSSPIQSTLTNVTNPLENSSSSSLQDPCVYLYCREDDFIDRKGNHSILPLSPRQMNWKTIVKSLKYIHLNHHDPSNPEQCYSVTCLKKLFQCHSGSPSTQCISHTNESCDAFNEMFLYHSIDFANHDSVFQFLDSCKHLGVFVDQSMQSSFNAGVMNTEGDYNSFDCFLQKSNTIKSFERYYGRVDFLEKPKWSFTHLYRSNHSLEKQQDSQHTAPSKHQNPSLIPTWIFPGQRVMFCCQFKQQPLPRTLKKYVPNDYYYSDSFHNGMIDSVSELFSYTYIEEFSKPSSDIAMMLSDSVSKPCPINLKRRFHPTLNSILTNDSQSSISDRFAFLRSKAAIFYDSLQGVFHVNPGCFVKKRKSRSTNPLATEANQHFKFKVLSRSKWPSTVIFDIVVPNTFCKDFTKKHISYLPHPTEVLNLFRPEHLLIRLFNNTPHVWKNAFTLSESKSIIPMEFANLQYIKPAYVITGYKSQSCQFSNVIVILDPSRSQNNSSSCFSNEHSSPFRYDLLTRNMDTSSSNSYKIVRCSFHSQTAFGSTSHPIFDPRILANYALSTYLSRSCFYTMCSRARKSIQIISGRSFRSFITNDASSVSDIRTLPFELQQLFERFHIHEPFPYCCSSSSSSLSIDQFQHYHPSQLYSTMMNRDFFEEILYGNLMRLIRFFESNSLRHYVDQTSNRDISDPPQSCE